MSERSAPRSLAPALAASAVLAACAWSCGTTDVAVFSLTQDAQGAQGTDGGLPETSLAEDAAPVPQDQQAFCNGTGPPELLDKTDGGTVVTCPDQLAQREFRYALCTCSSFGSDSLLFTDAFDGSKGAYDAGSAVAGGSVGVNGDLHPGPMHVGGSLWASNSTLITTSSVYVEGELHTQGEMRPATDTAVMADALDVEADAWMAGGLQTTGSVTINGTLHVPAGQPTDVTGTTFNYGAMDTQSLKPQPACDCTPEHLVDVAGIVATYAVDNDDDNLKITSNDLIDVQTDQTVVLDCGRAFYTNIVANQAAIDIKVQGHVALFVGGDISTDDLIIEVPTGSELDLFVAGDVTVRGNFMLGDASNPARARMYVGGRTVNLASASTIAGNLYAPQANLTLGASAPTTLFGALFVSQLQASADLYIHYDESVLTPSSTRACATPSSCVLSCDCSGLACNSGTCGPCSENMDCCAPFVCGAQGTCVAGVTPR